ncbi:MAG: glycosyltransferase family 2 protein [Methanobacterium sp.]|nr:glycosyltransferase family 2 protein [Methanobacterium sp.]
MKPLVTIIILNWNGWQDTLECLESLYQIQYPNYKVILVDNHSQDQSLTKIREYCQGQNPIESPFFTYQNKNKPIPIKEITYQENELTDDPDKAERENQLKNKPVNSEQENRSSKSSNQSSNQQNPTLILIKNKENYGFAKGNNIAMEYTIKKHNPEYILLLNNDTIVEGEFLTNMIKVAESDAKIGIVSGKLLNAYNPQIIDSTGHIIHWGRIIDRGHEKTDKHQYDDQTNVMGAMAAAALYKREMLSDIGLLDTTYITLGEDADLSWRAYNRGWKAVYSPNSIIYHKRGKSITKKTVLPKMTILSLKNTTEYVSRYGNFLQKMQFNLVITKEGLLVMIGSILGRNDVKAGEYFNMLIKPYLKIFKSFFVKKSGNSG